MGGSTFPPHHNQSSYFKPRQAWREGRARHGDRNTEQLSGCEDEGRADWRRPSSSVGVELPPLFLSKVVVMEKVPAPTSFVIKIKDLFNLLNESLILGV